MNLKNSGDSTGFEPMTSAMPVQCKARLIKSFRFQDTFAPLQDSHRFNIATVQNSAGLGNSAPGISLSTS